MNKRVFVAGLPFSSTQEELKNLFSEAGSVISATIITDRMTGQSKGFGFVEMETPEESEAAIAKFNGTEFGGRKLIVAEARPQEERSGSPGGPRRFGQRQSFGGHRGGRESFRRGRERGQRPGRGGFGR